MTLTLHEIIKNCMKKTFKCDDRQYFYEYVISRHFRKEKWLSDRFVK